MIVVYAEKQSMGLKFAASLGGIPLNGKLINIDSLTIHHKEIKDIATRDGYFKTRYNGKEYIITWGSGHFGTLKDAKDYNPIYSDWNLLPCPFFPQKYEIKPIVSDNDFYRKRDEKQLKIVKTLFNDPNCEYIINATDWEREGELIFGYTYQLTGSTKPYYRVHINKQTEKEIQKGFANIIPSSKIKSEENAARCRAIADWVLGINLTVAATLYLGDRNVLSLGRLITPTLNMIVEREKAINSFSSKVFYYVQGEFTTSNGQTYKGKHLEERLETKEEAENIIKTLPIEGEITVIDIIRSKSFAPNPYSLASLQKEANKKYGFTAKETLDIAQKLYEGGPEGGYITYPRTSSEYLTSDSFTEIDSVIKKLGNLSQYKPYIDMISHPIKVSKVYFDDKKVESHPAIMTTEVLPKTLTTEQAKIYDLIAKSVIRLAFEPCELDKTTLETKVGTETFITRGTIVVSPGWTVVDAEKKVENDIPNGLNIGDEVKGVYSTQEGKTEPPKRYTDATLIEAMENCGKREDDEEFKKVLINIEGIGRASTRDACIERLIYYKYITREKKNIIPTEMGINLIDTLPLQSLKSPTLTAKWEMDLDKISTGTYPVMSFLNDIQKQTASWCNMIKEKGGKILNDSNGLTSYKCPKCGEPIIATGQKLICSKLCGFQMYSTMFNHTFSEKELTELFTMKRTRYIKDLISTKGKNFGAYFMLANDKVNITFDSIWKCPRCGKPLQPISKKQTDDSYSGITGYKCSGYKDNNCSFYISANCCGVRLTSKHLKALLSMEKTEMIDDFVSSKGNKFSASLSFNKESDYKLVFHFPDKIIRGKEDNI